MATVLEKEAKEKLGSGKDATPYGLYIDDCGNDDTGKKGQPHFAIGGIMVRQSEEQSIREMVDTFKDTWKIPRDKPLHGTEIRSKQNSFSFLGHLNACETNAFHSQLLSLATESPITVLACVIHRQGYFDRFHPQYGKSLWKMRTSALAILIERAAKEILDRRGKLKLYYEDGGKTDNSITEDTYKRLRTSGHPFDESNASTYNPLKTELLNVLLGGIERKTKANHLIQLADLCIHPVTVWKDGRRNRWFEALKEQGKLIDCLLDEQSVLERGIKYYCFPSEGTAP